MSHATCLCEFCQAAQAQITTLTTTVQRLREALKTYGKHPATCRILTWQPHEDDAPTPVKGKCTCGLGAVLGTTPEGE